MEFLWATISVHDMDESLHFYQEMVGLSLNRRVQSNETTELAFLGDGQTQIELIHHSGTQAPETGKGISLGFAVEDLEGMMERIKEKGLTVYDGPFAPNAHVRFFYVLDPNGLKIQFVERR